MKSDYDSLREMIKEAIGIEAEGRKFYLSSAGKIKHPLARRVLNSLAEDEKKHAEALKKFVGKSAAGKGAMAVKGLSGKLRPDVRERVFGEPLKMAGKLKAEARATRIYDMALKLEEGSYAFYKRALEKTGEEEPALRKLLEFLVKEENAHHAILLETKDYIDNPEQWFLKEEKGIIEG